MNSMNRLFFRIVRKNVLSNLAILFLFSNCVHTVKNIENDGIRTIEIVSNIRNPQIVKLSEVALSIDYCMLETDKKCLIRNKSIYNSGEYFVYMSWDACYVFERKTGAFIRQISQIGQGPNDYQYAGRVLNGDKGQIFLIGNNQYLFFNIDGTLSHKTKVFANHFIAYENLYVRYVPNTMGNSTNRIAFHDSKTGEIIDSIPNSRFYKSAEGRSYSYGNDFSFHTFNNFLFYKDIYCDTLYQIKDFSLQPRYIFNTGGRTVPYESQIEGRADIQAMIAGRENDRYAKYIVVNSFFESTNFLLFTFDNRNMKYPVVYHKSEDKLHIMPSIPIPLLYLRDGKMPLFGLENDMDGGLPFWPDQMISENEMMCVYTAEELLELDRSKITDEKLKNVLNSLDIESNPVVAIVTLKN